MVALYPESDFSSTFERAKTAFGDTIFTCQSVSASLSWPPFGADVEVLRRDWFIAQKLLAAGKKSVYNYRWDTPDPVLNAAAPWKGVLHTSDLFFLFNGTK